MAKTLIYAGGSPTSVKIGDTDTDLYLQVAKDNAVVDLTAVKSITVKIADTNKNYLKDISISSSNLPDGNQGILVVPLNSDNINGLNSGDYYFEVWIATADGDSEIYPDMNVTKFHVFNNIVGGTTVLTTLTLQAFLDRITVNQINSETSLANSNATLTAANAANADATKALNDLKDGNYLTKDDLSNVLSYGADNTGKTDATSAIQKAIDSGTYGTYFPAGVYLISSPIEFPYGTNYPYSIELNANAHIVATASMDAMFKLGEKQATPDTLPYLKNNHGSELYELKGGLFHANCLANTAIQTGTNMTGFKINSVSIDGCLTSGIHLKAPSGTFSHDAILSNIRINYVHADADESKNSTGIIADVADWSISDSYICNVKVGILSNGYFSLSTVHLFSGWGSVPSIAVQCPGGITATNLYLDSYDTGISTLATDGSTHKTTFMQLSNLFYYEYDGHDMTYPVKVIDTKCDSDIDISNIDYQFSSKRASDGSRVIFLRDTDNDGSPSTIGIKNLNISGISPVADDNNNTNRISDMLFSGANKSREAHQVIQSGFTLNAGYGIIVAWIPASSAPYKYITQNFLASSLDKDLLVKCYLKLYTDSNGNVVLNNLGSIERLATPNYDVDWCIGPVQTINGCNFYPLYLYNNNPSYLWLDPVNITPMDSGMNSFIFPYNSNSASQIDSSTFVASTINGAIAVKYANGTKGNTSSRPTGISAGYQYFDTTLNKPIWYTGTAWVDATGSTV